MSRAGYKPTDEQIAEQIAKLKEIKPTVRRRSSFGDDHHEAIDGQVRVLEKGMTEDQIYNYFEPPGDEEQGRNVLDAALEARRWLDGEQDSPDPVASWQELVR